MSSPSNTSIDAIFERARSARISYVDGARIAVLDAEDLPSLRAALRIREGEESFHCMCMGTLSIELRGRWRTIGAVTYHHGQSLRMSGWSSDAWLEDGPALARLLAERGHEAPLRELEREAEAQRERDAARREWLDAVPSGLSLAVLESDAMGLPKRLSDTEIGAALESVGPLALLRWLAHGRGPFSGYASYEEVPMKLLRALPIVEVLAAIDSLSEERELFAAARVLSAHELVSFGKRSLALVPDALFARLAASVERRGTGDDRQRFEHARAVAEKARAARVDRAPYPAGGHVVLGESQDGPLSGLVARGDALISSDVQTIVRFDPESVVAREIVRASEHFVLLAGEWYATMNHGEVFALSGERVAHDPHIPVELSAYGDRVAWLSRDAPGGAAITIAGVRTIATGGHAWNLTLGDEHVYWMSEDELRRARIDDGTIDTIARIDPLGASMGTPRLVFARGELFVAFPDRIEAIERKRRVAKSKLPIRALAIDAEHIVALVGEEREWSFAIADGERLRTLASFSRAPYHRHPLVIARGHACTVLGDRVIGAPLR